MNNPDVKQIRRTNRRSIIILVVVFVLPPLTAWLVLKKIDVFKPSSTSNYGELIQPARPLLGFELKQSNGSSFGLNELKGKWHVVYFGGSECDKLCQETISKVHQARLGQGAEMHRLLDIYINVDGTSASEKTLNALKPLTDFLLLSGSATNIQNLLAQFQATGVSPTEAGRIFLVDPLGNVMMTYNHKFYVRDLLKDLERLLKYSQIG